MNKFTTQHNINEKIIIDSKSIDINVKEIDNKQEENIANTFSKLNNYENHNIIYKKSFNDFTIKLEDENANNFNLMILKTDQTNNNNTSEVNDLSKIMDKNNDKEITINNVNDTNKTFQSLNLQVDNSYKNISSDLRNEITSKILKDYLDTDNQCEVSGNSNLHDQSIQNELNILKNEGIGNENNNLHLQSISYISPEDIIPYNNETAVEFLQRLKQYIPERHIYKYVSKG